jgi:hypothetical protein
MADETHPYGRWQPWSPQEVAAFFAPFQGSWWVSGGWAIDLFLGRQTRGHDDIDVQVLRRDHQMVRGLFGAWDMQAALPPPRDESWPFRPWRLDELLDPAVHDIWCRPAETQPWAIQLMIADTRDGMWVFRRSPAITRPLDVVGCVSAEGIPYLAPEIQLLYKAKGLRPKDQADFEQALPALDQERREWLRDALSAVHPHHPWLTQLTGS